MFSTAQTEKNAWKKLGKTKLVVWWIDVTNKIILHLWSWAYVIYEWSHSKKRPHMRPASSPPGLARDSKRTSDWIRPPSAPLPMEAKAVAGTFKIVQYYWQTWEPFENRYVIRSLLTQLFANYRWYIMMGNNFRPRGFQPLIYVGSMSYIKVMTINIWLPKAKLF